MTNKIEQEFYDTFEIEKQCVCPYFPKYKENGCEICIKYFQGKKDCNEKKTNINTLTLRQKRRWS